MLKLERENKSRVLGALIALEYGEYTLIVDCSSAIVFEIAAALVELPVNEKHA